MKPKNRFRRTSMASIPEKMSSFGITEKTKYTTGPTIRGEGERMMKGGTIVMAKESGDWDWVYVEFSHFSEHGDLVDMNGVFWRFWKLKD
jgi:hypothetical protein